MKKIFITILYFSLVFASCKKSIIGIGSTVQQPVKSGVAVATNLNNDLLLKLVNDKRATGCNCGITIMPSVAPLTWNNLLAAAALAHSKDMNTNNYFSHTSLDGRSAGDRITVVGYKWSAYGENIASGQTSEQAVFDAWITSEGHCKNIMNANFKEMAVARDGKYWTQEFGKQ
ncbi:MAG: CAP domain-containing protein [Chitinophagaceae bacterium]|nr:MAG: CAP domain-containing protein [Chitinophagaceae bacterium]